jgi:hypothetical protein
LQDPTERGFRARCEKSPKSEIGLIARVDLIGRKGFRVAAGPDEDQRVLPLAVRLLRAVAGFARSSLTTLPTALAPIGLMTVPVAFRRVVPLIDRPA